MLPGWLQLFLQLVPVATLVLGLPFIARLGKSSGAENRKVARENKQLELQNEKLEIELGQLRDDGVSTDRRQKLGLDLSSVRQKPLS